MEGIKNSIFPKEAVEEVAAERLAICKACNYHSSNAKSKGYKTSRIDDHCTHCSCTLHTKTRSMHAACPIKKWEAIITPDEQQSLNTIKRNNDNQKHSGEATV